MSLQVHTYEEIVPTRSYVPHSRTFATAYSVVTHTATVTQDTAGGEQTLYTITRGATKFLGNFHNMRFLVST